MGVYGRRKPDRRLCTPRRPERGRPRGAGVEAESARPRPHRVRRTVGPGRPGRPRDGDREPTGAAWTVPPAIAIPVDRFSAQEQDPRFDRPVGGGFRPGPAGGRRSETPLGGCRFTHSRGGVFGVPRDQLPDDGLQCGDLARVRLRLDPRGRPHRRPHRHPRRPSQGGLPHRRRQRVDSAATANNAPKRQAAGASSHPRCRVRPPLPPEDAGGGRADVPRRRNGRRRRRGWSTPERPRPGPSGLGNPGLVPAPVLPAEGTRGTAGMGLLVDPGRSRGVPVRALRAARRAPPTCCRSGRLASLPPRRTSRQRANAPDDSDRRDRRDVARGWFQRDAAVGGGRTGKR